MGDILEEEGIDPELTFILDSLVQSAFGRSNFYVWDLVRNVLLDSRGGLVTRMEAAGSGSLNFGVDKRG